MAINMCNIIEIGSIYIVDSCKASSYEGGFL